MNKHAQIHTNLEEIINKALKKIGSQRENDLCHFLPAENDGYIHHFTLRKMKHSQPETLAEMIERHVLCVDNPGKIQPKQRAARGTRKKRDVITLTRSDVERLLDNSRKVGDREMVAKLSPKRSPTILKRDLIKSIRAGRFEPDLWDAYSEHASTTSLNQEQFA